MSGLARSGRPHILDEGEAVRHVDGSIGFVFEANAVRYSVLVPGVGALEEADARVVEVFQGSSEWKRDDSESEGTGLYAPKKLRDEAEIDRKQAWELHEEADDLEAEALNKEYRAHELEKMIVQRAIALQRRAERVPT